MDAAGRIVIPKAIREQERLEPGAEFDISARDGTIELRVEYQPVRLEHRNGRLVAVADPRAPVLTNEAVNRIIERERRRAGCDSE